ncbi:DsbA family protein [candidate division WWE3 bacterium]|uniref:DsbA family protein n=1 Tax=candidate division WWE3 bacterium TaxID=2053526 RepID=A0A955LW99_UNCKA|nr:DsbA family protein [candidate division WWE3 bacterium]
MKSDYKIIAIVVIVSIVIFGGLIWLMDSSQTPQDIDESYLIGAAPHEKGASEEEAILTIVEFSDFQCPACQAAEPIINDFVEAHKDEVRVIYRHFPLVSIHLNAREAAIASEVAAESGLFWDYHDLLFDKQTEWGSVTDPTDLFLDYAESLDLDREEFAKKLEVDTYMLEVREYQNVTLDLNLTSTPTFFFNGKLHRGVPSMDTLTDALAEAQEAAS